MQTECTNLKLGNPVPVEDDRALRKLPNKVINNINPLKTLYKQTEGKVSNSVTNRPYANRTQIQISMRSPITIVGVRYTQTEEESFPY